MNFSEEIRDILCCPKCREKFVYNENDIFCPICNKRILVDDRLLDFSQLTPDLPLGFARYTQELHEYAGQVMEDLKIDWRIKAVLGMVKKKAKGRVCLEIGGGDGPMTPYLENLFDVVLTIDFSKNFLKRIESKTQRTLCLFGDGHFLPIKDRAVDTVVCSELLEHVTIPTQLLFEIRRVMKKDAVCILSVPNEAMLPPFRSWRINQIPAGDSHINFFNPVTLNKLLFRMGLEIIELRTLFPAFVSLKSVLKNFLKFLVGPKLYGQYILCLVKVMDTPGIYWESLKKAIK